MADMTRPGHSKPQSSIDKTNTDDACELRGLDEYETELGWLDDLLMNQGASEEEGPTDDDSQLSLSHLDRKLSKLLSVLEVAIADTSSLVEKSIEDIERGVPRLTLDLQLMRENALLLRYSLETIQAKSELPPTHPKTRGLPTPSKVLPSGAGESRSGEDETDEILSRLKTLDLIKARMESSRTVLREAEAWSTLESEVTGYLTDAVPSHLKAAERLAEAAKSMIVFQHTPEYEGRRGLMRSLQNELEASLSTNLVKALGDKDVKRCKEFFEIFKMIEREGEFKNYYFGSRRSAISANWNEVVLSLPSSAPRSDRPRPNSELAQTLPVFLSRQFYPSLLKLLQTELDFLPFIFTNPVDTLTAFLTTTIDNLKPSISTRLVENVDSAHVLASWPNLISCWNITQDAGWKVENLISQLKSNIKEAATAASANLASPVSEVGSSTPKPARRSSLKRPISRTSGSRSGIDFLIHEDVSPAASNQVSDPIKDWETSLYEPFTDFQSNYHERELNYLQAASKNATLTLSAQLNLEMNWAGQKLTATASRTLPDLLESLFNLGDQALDRCEAFTHGYGLLGCLKAIDSMLSECLESHTYTLMAEREEREKKNGAKDQRQGSTDAGGRAAGVQTYLDESDNQVLELEGLDYSSEDWEIFQQGLKLLAACKTTYDKLAGYEKKTKSRVLEMISRMRQNSNETVALNEDLKVVRIKLSKGGKVLLKESNLNNNELWEFLDAVQPQERTTPSTLAHRREPSTALLNPSAAGAKRPSIPPPKPSSMAQASAFYPKSNATFLNLIRECQHIVQSIILLPLLKQVNDYPSLPIWSQSEMELQKMNQMNSISTIDLKILDQFSKSPTELISKLGEGLFNLPRLFEIYTTVEEDALSFSLETLPFIDQKEFLNNLQEYRKANEGENSNPAGSRSISFSSEMVISTWLSSLTLAVVNQVTEHTLPLLVSRQRLSPSGKNQLVIDLDYLGNVVKALDVDSDSLEKVRERLFILT